MSDTTPTGWLDLNSTVSNKTAHEFLIKKLINRLATTAMVKVTAVTNSGGVSAIGFVDVVPMVHQTDGAGNPTPHGTINHLPYFRIQGGAYAVIIDPKVGDTGFAVFCSRDISAVKRQKAPAAPGSRRRYDWADGIYVGSALSGVPTDYVRISDTGVDIVTTNHLTITADNVTLDASGNLIVKGEVTAKDGANKVTLTGHIPHAASGTTVPTPGH